MRADYLGCYGHPTIGTKHIDRLASEGARLENCYCQSPLCAPSRISFATSTYVGEHGCRNYWSTIDPAVPNLVTSLKSAGYRTAMFGKNHLFTYEKLPELWDELDEVCLGNYDAHPSYEKAYTAFELEEEHPYNITGRLTDQTIDFMERSSEPFFAWVNYQDPHPAFTCPRPYSELFDPDDIELPETFRDFDPDSQPFRNEVWRRHSEMEHCADEDMRKAIATYMGQIRYVDDGVGKIMQALEASGKAKDTLILFFSDHGELLGDHGMTHKLPAFYESLARIPAIIRHPDGRWANTAYKGLTEEIDLVPTLLDTLGIQPPATMVGNSLKDDLDEQTDAGKESILCEAGGGAPTVKTPVPGLAIKAPHLPTSLGPGSMLRAGPWKISVYHDDRGELYNIENDPAERRNLFEDPNHKDIRDKLVLQLAQRLLGVKVRDLQGPWPESEGHVDPRFEPLHKFAHYQDQPETIATTNISLVKDQNSTIPNTQAS